MTCQILREGGLPADTEESTTTEMDEALGAAAELLVPVVEPPKQVNGHITEDHTLLLKNHLSVPDRRRVTSSVDALLNVEGLRHAKTRMVRNSLRADVDGTLSDAGCDDLGAHNTRQQKHEEKELHGRQMRYHLVPASKSRILERKGIFRKLGPVTSARVGGLVARES